MNWKHLKAFAWLRWRLMRNQWRRAGKLNAVLMTIVAIGAVMTAIPLFIGSIALGVYLIPEAEPAHLMYAWDAMVVGLLFFWMIGLITELQRTEVLSLSKFLHLPVSVSWAFAINYLSSLIRLSLIIFGPIMLGYALALVYVKGPTMILVLPLLAAFLLMLTALSYQFQGWLASMMSNPRRRRTVVMATTAAIVLVSQLPNMLSFYMPWGRQQTELMRAQAEKTKAYVRRARAYQADMEGLTRSHQLHQIDAAEYSRRFEKLKDDLKLATPRSADPEEIVREEQARRSDESAKVERIAKIANMVLPIGWLPLGVMTAAEGQILPSLLGLAGLTLIGSASLWRAYRTTIRLYQGESTNRKHLPKPPAKTPAISGTPRRSMLEARLPGLSEPVSAVALGSLRSLLRAPEAKMMLLTPIIMIPLTGSMVIRGGHNFPELIRPLIAVAGMIMVLFGLLQLMGNQFGFDRDGFRVYVLCAARRRDILLGKNLAFAPIALIMAAIVLSIVQFVCPLRADHLLATFPQYVSMFLLFCILANALSILAPVHIVAGSMRQANPKLTAVLLQLAMFLLAFPLTQALVLIPLGVEALMWFSGWPPRLPVYLVLALVDCVAIVFLYRFSLEKLGALLQAREQRILESVTNRAP